MPATEWDYSKLPQLRHLLVEKKSLAIRIVSGSMVPLLPIGSSCRIEAVTFDEIKNFDLIVFFSEAKLICHVVWMKQYLPAANGERTLITRGLNSVGFDYPVRESEIVGRVISHQMSWWHRFLFVLKARFSIFR